MFDPPVESKTGLPIEEIFLNNGTFEISDDDILKTALNTAKWSALGGTGGLLLYKFGRPFLSKLGLVPQGLRFDLDEDSFLKAYDSYTKTGAKKSAEEIGVVPSSAQVAKIASEDSSLSPLEKTQMGIDAKMVNDMMKQTDVRILKGPKR